MANPGPAIAGIPNTELALSTGALQRTIIQAPITGTAAQSNNSLGLLYFNCPAQLTASRLDALYNFSLGTAATSCTAANAVSAWGGIYTSFVSTNTAGSTSALSLLSSGTTQFTVSIASNNSGQSWLSAAAIRPVSVPMNVNMVPGEYWIGFALATATSSSGAATTTVGCSFSNMLGASNVTASAYIDNGYTAVSNSTSNLWGYQGLYTSSITALPVTINQSLIAQTGANMQAGQFACVLRNY